MRPKRPELRPIGPRAHSDHGRSELKSSALTRSAPKPSALKPSTLKPNAPKLSALTPGPLMPCSTAEAALAVVRQGCDLVEGGDSIVERPAHDGQLK